MVEKLRKLGSSRRTNRRSLFFGILLIVASGAGVWALIAINNHTDEYLVANAPLASGSKVSSTNFSVAQMNLSGSSAVYLKPGDLIDGTYLLNTVDAGQLVPKNSVATNIIDAREPVLITSLMALPKKLKVGDFVDIWVSDAIENNKFAPPAILVLNAEISDIIEDTGVLSNQQPKLQVLVPNAAVSPILDAIASKDALSAVLKRNLGDE